MAKILPDSFIPRKLSIVTSKTKKIPNPTR